MNIGDPVTIVPKTKKGRERVKAHGDTGAVLDIRQSVAFSDNQGPWILVSAGDVSSRWIHLADDSDFIIRW